MSKTLSLHNDEIAISVRNISFAYEEDRDVLSNIDFDIPAGKYTAIIGHNGSGKSTLSKLLLGLQFPTEGEIFIFNKSFEKHFHSIRHNIGVVFQNPDNQFIGTTVEDDIAFGLENRQVKPEEMPALIEAAAELVNMEKFLKYEPQRLSGGQKQAVAIASVLALNAKIMIFDEATSMLDPLGKTKIKHLMRKICDEKKKTIISITHDMDEAFNADFVIVLSNGRLFMADKPEVVFGNSENLKQIQLKLPFFLELSEIIRRENKKFPLCKNFDELENAVCK